MNQFLNMIVKVLIGYLIEQFITLNHSLTEKVPQVQL